MSVLFLLGSGVSYKTGLPNTYEITNDLLNGVWHKYTGSAYFPGQNPTLRHTAEVDVTVKLQAFLKYLKNYSDNYLNTLNEPEVNYEDLFFYVNEINNHLTGETNNTLLKPFIDQINNHFNFQNNTNFKSSSYDLSLEEICDSAIDFINCVIWNLLSTNKSPIGFDLLYSTSKNFQKHPFDIITLNHDILLENYFESEKINFSDGFSNLDGDFYYFTPEVYNNTNQIRIFKLHGSINWYRLRKFDNSTSVTTDYYIKKVGGSFMRCQDALGDYYNTLETYPIFLTGTENKLSDYNFGIIKYVFLKFYEVLSLKNIIIMSGYGWNDKGINGILFEWILSSSNKKIILLYENPEELKKSRSAMWHRYDDLIKWGRIIPIRKWFSDVQYSDIQPYL